ncbi:MAG: GNAT family N-acetyltransferase [Pseudomonadota bacterium]
MTLRPPVHADIPALQALLETIALFPAGMLPEMIAPCFTGGEDAPVWLVRTRGELVVGFCFAEPEPMTEGTWNMRAIGVAHDHQGAGHGAALVHGLEDTLRTRGGRILIVDTSGTEDFAGARTFYRQRGYAEEARIRDFWSTGDDKIVFRKALA